MCFEIVRLTEIYNEPKWTIFASGGLELLQIVSELDTRWGASEDVGPPREVDCEISHRLERGTSIPYRGVETSP